MNKNKAILIGIFTLIFNVVIILSLNSVRAEENASLPADFQPPGKIKGSGTHFEITNSDYLNLILDSSESINVTFESIPEMVTIIITPISSTPLTQLTISGLLPSATYYLYQDDYHNLTQIIADENGRYSYIQDLSRPHLIFIQSRSSTKFIKDDTTGGDCHLIGNWDLTSKTCSLTRDLTETIQIDNDNIILDGNGHILTGSYTGSGIYLYQKTNVIIKNFIIKKFPYGIYLFNSNTNELINNTISNANGSGMYFYGSITNNKIINNTAEFNSDRGIYFEFLYRYGPANDNLIENNISNSNAIGIHIEGDNNNIKNNVLNNNYSGIVLFGSNNNLFGNNLSSNRRSGIYLSGLYHDNNIISNFVSDSYICVEITGNAYNNIVKNNTISNTTLYNYYGVHISYAWDNLVYNNNFIGDRLLAYSYPWLIGNVNFFNLDKPIGGNYWSRFDTPAEGCNDLDNDNFCDSPYCFTGDQDNLPWKIQNGWAINQPPITSNLSQYKIYGYSPIEERATTTGNEVIFKATLNDPDNDNIKLEIELKSKDGTFSEILNSGFISSGGIVSITRENLIEKPAIYAGNNTKEFYWKARAIDSQGNASNWQEFGIPGNIDFIVKTVPLYTQVRSPYPSEAATDDWARAIYANGRGNLGAQPCGLYIRDCGCAITSMIILSRYYNISTAINNSEANPLNINTWLNDSANNGYNEYGNLYWSKAIEYLGFIDNNGNKMARLNLDHYNAISTSLIDNYVSSPKPIVAYSDTYGHYFIIDDKVKTGPTESEYTHILKDPRWYNTKTLNDAKDALNNIQGYANFFNTANLFSYLETPQKITASIYLYLASPAELLVADPLGRKLGKNPTTNITYNEIPNSSYTEEGPIVTSDTPLDLVQIHKTKVIYIPKPIDGNYDIRVIGTDTGEYTATALTYDNQGNSHTQTQIGSTEANLTIGYDLNFTPDVPENIAFQPEDTEAPVISHTSINLEYILNSAPITFNFSVQDTGTGVFNLSATLDGQPIADGQTISFTQLGNHEIIITTEDHVGNIATEVINFDVIYNFSGYLPPVKSDGSGIYKLGRTLPIKFKLVDANNVYISTAVAKLFITKISDGIVGTDEIPLSTSNADTGGIFRYNNIDNQYIYNLSTDTLSVGSWQLKVVLGDRKNYTVVISIK